MNRLRERLKIRCQMTIRDVIERHGHFAHGGSPESAAEAWAKLGFEPADIDAWLFARCFVPQVARDLTDAGMTAEMARLKTSVGTADYVDTVGFKVSEGDLTIKDACALTGLR